MRAGGETIRAGGETIRAGDETMRAGGETMRAGGENDACRRRNDACRRASGVKRFDLLPVALEHFATFDLERRREDAVFDREVLEHDE